MFNTLRGEKPSNDKLGLEVGALYYTVPNSHFVLRENKTFDS